MVSNAKDVCRQETGKRDVFGREKAFDFRGEHATQVDGGVGAFDEGAAVGEVAAGAGAGEVVEEMVGMEGPVKVAGDVGEVMRSHLWLSSTSGLGTKCSWGLKALLDRSLENHQNAFTFVKTNDPLTGSFEGRLLSLRSQRR